MSAAEEEQQNEQDEEPLLETSSEHQVNEPPKSPRSPHTHHRHHSHHKKSKKKSSGNSADVQSTASIASGVPIAPLQDDLAGLVVQTSSRRHLMKETPNEGTMSNEEVVSEIKDQLEISLTELRDKSRRDTDKVLTMLQQESNKRTALEAHFQGQLLIQSEAMVAMEMKLLRLEAMVEQRQGRRPSRTSSDNIDEEMHQRKQTSMGAADGIGSSVSSGGEVPSTEEDAAVSEEALSNDYEDVGESSDLSEVAEKFGRSSREWRQEYEARLDALQKRWSSE